MHTQEPVAALTFDDGPDPKFTPRLLEILERHRARATFFMLGENARRYPELVKRAGEAGHAIGNHSWDHPSFPLVTARERRAQIRACGKAIAPYGQRLFRPPYGHQSVPSRFDAFCLGYQVIGWNLTAEDWLDHHANRMAERLLKEIRPGSVILLHDGLFDALDARYFDRTPILNAIQIVLHSLDNAFRFVTIPELLRQGRPHKQDWYRTPSVDSLNKLKKQHGERRRYADSSRQKLAVGLPSP